MRAYGRRTDKLAMELYESILDGQQYTTDHKRVILNIIQQQALENFQIGLNDDIKMVVRSRGYMTLQEVISAASAEEKVKGPTIVSTRPKSAAMPTYYHDIRNTLPKMRKNRASWARMPYEPLRDTVFVIKTGTTLARKYRR